MREDIISFNRTEHPFSVQMAGISYCDGTYHIHRDPSNITCIEYIIDGKGYVHHDDVSFTASKGDVYILNAKHCHDYYSDSQAPWTKIWFNVYGDFATQTIEHYGLANSNLFKDYPLEPLFHEFINNVKSKKTVNEIFDDCLLVFLKIIQALAKHRSKCTGTSLASRLKNMIDNDIDYKYSLDDYSDMLYCSKQYAITKFKEEYDITPHQYVIDKKIQTAKNLLLNTSYSVSQIAELLNFCDEHYFSTFFKRINGVSPLQYKNDPKFCTKL